jgi:hypothetical protein
MKTEERNNKRRGGTKLPFDEFERELPSLVLQMGNCQNDIVKSRKNGKERSKESRIAERNGQDGEQMPVFHVPDLEKTARKTQILVGKDMLLLKLGPQMLADLSCQRYSLGMLLIRFIVDKKSRFKISVYHFMEGYRGRFSSTIRCIPSSRLSIPSRI